MSTSVAPQIRERIIKGEFIDFITLLPKAMFSSSMEPYNATSFTAQLQSNSRDLSVHPAAKPKRTIILHTCIVTICMWGSTVIPIL